VTASHAPQLRLVQEKGPYADYPMWSTFFFNRACAAASDRTAGAGGGTGRVYLITGSTDGIGRHTALKLAQTGATVLVHGRCAWSETRRNLGWAVRNGGWGVGTGEGDGAWEGEGRGDG
jgi:hypothetical protein